MKDKFKINKTSIKEIITWLLGGILLLFTTEYIQRSSFTSIITFAKDRTNAFAINLLIILLITSITFILKRKKIAYFLISVTIIAISLISAFMTSLRGTPLTYSDLFSIKDGLSIANKYISLPILIGAITLIILTILITVYLFKKDKNEIRITSITNIIIAITTAIVLSVSVISLRERKILDVLRWDLKESYYHNGFVYSILDSCFGYIRKKPEDYNKANIENIKNEINSVEAMSTENSITSTNNKTKKPNIIFVQLESFIDPTLIKEAKFSEDPIPNFRKLSKENLSGNINVPVTGGGTARTEFEVLTGNNFDYLIPGEIPYDSFVKEKNVNSIATTLKKQGYQTTIMHNFQGNFYNRNKAFENLGFDTFISMEYMQNLEETFLGWRKDMVLLDYIQKSLKQNEKPDLVYAIAVEGHGKYPDYDKGLDLPIKVETTLSEQDKYQLYHYANLLKGTDDFIGKLMEMVDKEEEDTMVVFYSDHTPALNVFLKDDFYLDKYETPYAVYANFDIPKEKLNLESYQLSTLAMGLSEVEYGPIETIHAMRGNNENYQKELELVQYDMLFGKNYYLNDEDKVKDNKMKMGLEDIVIDSIDNNNGKIIINGKNFNKSSCAYINGKKVETTLIDSTKLEVNNIKDVKEVVVKQLGKYDAPIGESNEFVLK